MSTHLNIVVVAAHLDLLAQAHCLVSSPPRDSSPPTAKRSRASNGDPNKDYHTCQVGRRPQRVPWLRRYRSGSDLWDTSEGATGRSLEPADARHGHALILPTLQVSFVRFPGLSVGPLDPRSPPSQFPFHHALLENRECASTVFLLTEKTWILLTSGKPMFDSVFEMWGNE